MADLKDTKEVKELIRQFNSIADRGLQEILIMQARILLDMLQFEIALRNKKEEKQAELLKENFIN